MQAFLRSKADVQARRVSSLRDPDARAPALASALGSLGVSMADVGFSGCITAHVFPDDDVVYFHRHPVKFSIS